jgi:proteasome lid subunit RPN8/RPN11
VSSSGALRLASSVIACIRADAAAAYPYEGCGALLGPDAYAVSETLALRNEESDKPRTRFSVSPLDYLRVERLADARGLKLLGFWHSHPDHPARPSPTDREYAWEGLLTLVIAVEKGTPQDLTAWEIRAADAPFSQLPIVVAGEATQEVACP